MSRILIIDDDQQMRSILKRMLEENGHEVMEAGEGQEGFDTYRRTPTDAIILDLNLSTENGLDIIVRFLRSYPDAKIVATSGGILNERLLRDAERLGAVASLSKPFAKEKVLQLIAKVLRFA